MKARCDELDCRGRARVVCWEQKSERVREAVIRCALCACDGCRPAVGEEAQSAARKTEEKWCEQHGGDKAAGATGMKDTCSAVSHGQNNFDVHFDSTTYRVFHYVIGTELLFVLVSHQLSILSESGKAEMPSSEFIISAISSFCSRLHALPVSEFDAAPTMAAMAFCRFEICFKKCFFQGHAKNTTPVANSRKKKTSEFA